MLAFFSGKSDICSKYGTAFNIST